ncbi:MAG: ferredoxin [Nocardioides sp.]|nr:ferredoxin [Nocardioides sp.]
MRIVADTAICQGHQECTAEFPDLFGFDEDAFHVVVTNPEPGEERRADALAAVKYCPAFALSVEED